MVGGLSHVSPAADSFGYQSSGGRGYLRGRIFIFFLFDDLVQVMTPCAHRHLLLLMLSGHYHRHGFC
jgi:hypothetical protein